MELPGEPHPKACSDVDNYLLHRAVPAFLLKSQYKNSHKNVPSSVVISKVTKLQNYIQNGHFTNNSL